MILCAVAADLRGFATKVIKKVLEPGSGGAKVEVRARQLMALRCRAAALYVKEELDLQLQQLTATLFPPRNMEDAEALATGSNTAVPFLVAGEELKENEAAASVRALRLIGTSQSRQALRSFLGDRRESVVSELSLAVNPLEIDWVREALLEGEALPEGIQAQISDLSPLSTLTNLQSLVLNETQVADLSPLATLTNLQSLFLDRTQVVDLSPLATLTNLKILDLSETQVADLSPLAAFTNLQILDLDSTQVADLSPLAALTNLQILDLDWTQVADLSPLDALTNMQSLYLNGTPAADLSPLATLTNLQHLELNGTQIIDLSPIATLTNLQRLELNGTQIMDLSPIATLTNLKILLLMSTQVVDLAPLATLTNLHTLHFDANLEAQGRNRDLLKRFSRIFDPPSPWRHQYEWQSAPPAQWGTRHLGRNQE